MENTQKQTEAIREFILEKLQLKKARIASLQVPGLGVPQPQGNKQWWKSAASQAQSSRQQRSGTEEQKEITRENLAARELQKE